jgi:hypothetical protein
MIQETFQPVPVPGEKSGPNGEDFIEALDQDGIPYGTALALTSGLILRLDQAGLRGRALYKTYLREAADLLSSMGLSADAARVAKKLWAAHRPVLARNQGPLGEKLLSEIDVVGGIKQRCMVVQGGRVFDAIRKRMAKTKKCSMKEAMRIARENKILLPAQYERLCRSNPMLGLPANPERAYPDFPGWKEFLGAVGSKTLEALADHHGWGDASRICSKLYRYGNPGKKEPRR